MKKLLLKFCMVFTMLTIGAFGTLKAQSNQYLDFDGVDDFVTVANGSQLISGATGFSMTGWFYDNQLSYGQGMMGFRGTGGGFYMIELNNGLIECRFQNSGGTLVTFNAPAYTIVPQVWQHYAWVYGAGSCKLYLNGNLVGSVNATGTITSTAIPFAIGKSLLSGFNFVYNGRIDEVSVWNKALTQLEIQDMVANELTGTEPNLQMYFKFNQGVPGGNNTSIASLHNELNSPLYDGTFNLFALNGATSNFNGTLNPSFQAISFPQISTKLTTSPPFVLNATASSGLPVTYTLISGPATLNGDTVTVTGAGTVSIEASQPGNLQYDTAVSIVNTFDVVDPTLNTPVIEARNPLDATDVYMPALSKMQLAAVVNIPYPGLFSVQSVAFIINGVTYPAQDFANGHYTAWWTPTAYGAQTIQMQSTSNFGAISTINVNINVVQTASNINALPAFSGVLLNTDSSVAIRDGFLPSYVGAFDTIIATLTLTCPPGGCGEWDRVASLDVRGHDGQWFEVIRYITPYGVPCSHSINLADYMSLLQGKVSFRVNCGTLDNGYFYALSFDFKEGAPPHIYSNVTKVWKAIYPFGDYANLLPVPQFNHVYPATAVASKLKLVSTGHGWGNLNTGNAAEFYDATHNIWVNGANTFSQHNWTVCSPNPDACSPQNGTWFYPRAGWCPGAIARPFDYDLTPFIASTNIGLDYKFFSSYVDQCHPNNPNCVTGVTCTDCSDGFNPVLDVNCNLITFFDDGSAMSVDENENVNLVIYPNPSKGVFNLNTFNSKSEGYTVTVYTLVGDVVKQFNWDGKKTTLDLSTSPKSIYIVKVSNEKSTMIKRLIVQ